MAPSKNYGIMGFVPAPPAQGCRGWLSALIFQGKTKAKNKKKQKQKEITKARSEDINTISRVQFLLPDGVRGRPSHWEGGRALSIGQFG